MNAAAPTTWVVAVDGPAGVGKSTIARRLADDLAWAYLDTGATYRLVTLAALDAGVPLEDPLGIVRAIRTLEATFETDGRVLLDGADVSGRLRSPDVTEAVPQVAALADVRAPVVEYQRRMARREGRLVAEGRDTGSVVFPDAVAKVFLDASAEERARRRRAQDLARGAPTADLDTVLARLRERDRLDTTRAISPLICADDAWRLDTTPMTLDEVFVAVRSHVRSRIPIIAGDGS